MAPMHFTCTGLEALFPGASVALRSAGPLSVSLDCHDRPPFILRAVPLEVSSGPEAAPTDLIRLRLRLAPEGEFQAAIRAFAGLHALPLALPAPPGNSWEEPLLLAASHVAQGKMFVFSEEAVLRCRLAGPREVECEVSGPFKARRLPCRENDVILHLEAPATARLLSWLLAVSGAAT